MFQNPNIYFTNYEEPDIKDIDNMDRVERD